MASISTLNLKSFSIKCSYIEIYNEEIFDLLSKKREKKKLRVNPKTGLFIENLQKPLISSAKEILSFIKMGDGNRSVGATEMNKNSSRSHSIFSVYVEMVEV